MALFDIKTLIAQRGLTPTLNSQSMFKQITFDDQWIGYDDADTVALKKGWGNDYCFGGTMQVSDSACCVLLIPTIADFVISKWTLDLGHF